MVEKDQALVSERLQVSYFETDKKLRELLEINQEAHPAVIEARSELEAMNKKIEAEIETAIKRIEIDLNSLENKAAVLSDFIDQGLYKKIIAFNMIKKDITTKIKQIIRYLSKKNI